MRKVIWALFDSETHSAKHALEDRYDVYSFGIGTGTEHIELDLSNSETAIAALEKYPRPDYILASPPCETWVSVSGANLHLWNERGHSLYWKNRWTPFDLIPKHKERREMGMKTAATTAEIIKYFAPDAWAIENGNSSLIFDFLADFCGLNGHRNAATYYGYGDNTLKPTIIYSNARLSLKHDRPKSMSERDALLWATRRAGDGDATREKRLRRGAGRYKNDYADRSKVPAALYHDILRQFELGGQPTLFPLEEIVTKKTAVISERN